MLTEHLSFLSIDLLVFDFKLVLFAELGCANNHSGKSEEGDCVGDNHQVIEHIRQLPNEVVLEDSAEEYEYKCDCAVSHVGHLAEELK